MLYRDFLFSIVDRELLSTYAKGDASQLLHRTGLGLRHVQGLVRQVFGHGR